MTSPLSSSALVQGVGRSRKKFSNLNRSGSSIPSFELGRGAVRGLPRDPAAQERMLSPSISFLSSKKPNADSRRAPNRTGEQSAFDQRSSHEKQTPCCEFSSSTQLFGIGGETLSNPLKEEILRLRKTHRGFNQSGNLSRAPIVNNLIQEFNQHPSCLQTFKSILRTAEMKLLDGNPREAIELLQRCERELSFLSDLEYTKLKHQLFSTMGEAYAKLGQAPLSLAYFKSALEVIKTGVLSSSAGPRLEEWWLLSATHFKVGQLLVDLKRMEEGIQHFEESIRLGTQCQQQLRLDILTESQKMVPESLRCLILEYNKLVSHQVVCYEALGTLYEINDRFDEGRSMYFTAKQSQSRLSFFRLRSSLLKPQGEESSWGFSAFEMLSKWIKELASFKIKNPSAKSSCTELQKTFSNEQAHLSQVLRAHIANVDNKIRFVSGLHASYEIGSSDSFSLAHQTTSPFSCGQRNGLQGRISSWQTPTSSSAALQEPFLSLNQRDFIIKTVPSQKHKSSVSTATGEELQRESKSCQTEAEKATPGERKEQTKKDENLQVDAKTSPKEKHQNYSFKLMSSVSAVKRGSQMATLLTNADLVAKAKAMPVKKAPEQSPPGSAKEESSSESSESQASSSSSSSHHSTQDDETELEFETSEQSIASDSTLNEIATVDVIKKMPARCSKFNGALSEYERRKLQIEQAMRDALSLYACPISEVQYLNDLIKQKEITSGVPRSSVSGEANLLRFDKRKTRLEVDLQILKDLQEECEK